MTEKEVYAHGDVDRVDTETQKTLRQLRQHPELEVKNIVTIKQYGYIITHKTRKGMHKLRDTLERHDIDHETYTGPDAGYKRVYRTSIHKDNVKDILRIIDVEKKHARL